MSTVETFTARVLAEFDDRSLNTMLCCSWLIGLACWVFLVDDLRYSSEFCLHHSFSAAVFLCSSSIDFLDILKLFLRVVFIRASVSSSLLSLLECALLVSPNVSRLKKLTDVLLLNVPLEVVGVDVVGLFFVSRLIVVGVFVVLRLVIVTGSSPFV